MVEDLSRFKASQSTARPEVFDPTKQPLLWVFRETEESPPHSYAFGYPCGHQLCLMPLKDDELDAERVALWAAPRCKSEEDAKRVFFLINQLLHAIGSATSNE